MQYTKQTNPIVLGHIVIQGKWEIVAGKRGPFNVKFKKPLKPKNGQCEWEWGNQGEKKGKREKNTPKL
jgi:hypothetical protein